MSKDRERILCLIKGQLLVSNPQLLKDIDEAVYNEGVRYVANKPRAQIIENMAHIKMKSNSVMTEYNKELLLLWKADVNSSLCTTFANIFSDQPKDLLQIHQKLHSTLDE